MVAKIAKSNFGNLNAKALHFYLKNGLEDDSLYAAIAYIPDSDFIDYATLKDSEYTYKGGLIDSDFDLLDQTFYNQNTYALHKVFVGGVSRVIPRVNWEYGEFYNNYPSKEKSYVLVKEFISGFVKLNVYQCVFSPRTPSYYSPTSTSTTPFELPDGYVWKYMYSIENSEAIKFLNEDWMPVPERIKSSEYSQYSTDSLNFDYYISQINSEPGTVFNLTVDSDQLIQTLNSNAALAATFNWSQMDVIGTDIATNNPSKTFRCKVLWNSVRERFELDIIDSGSGYLGPVKVSLDSDSAAIPGLSAYVSPNGGHGSNVPEELGADYLMISVRNIPDENSQIFFKGSPMNLTSLLLNPIDRQTGTTCIKDFYVACNSFETQFVNQYVVGEILKPNFVDDGRRMVIIATNSNRVYYLSTKPNKEYDSFIAGESVCLENNLKVNTISKVYNREIIFDKGSLILSDFKDQRVNRVEGQIESFNFVIGFQ